MSRPKNIKFIIGFGVIILATGLIINACHKDKPVVAYCTDVTNPACPNYNPCLSQNATNAAFSLYEHLTNQQDFIYSAEEPTDTMYQGATFKLVPTYVPTAGKAKGWTYKYIINNRDTFNTDSTYNFSSRYIRDTFTNGVSGILKVKLYVHSNNPNQKCFPHDTGTDTLTKFFTTIPTFGNAGFKASVFGKYQGALTSNPNDTFSVTLLNNVVDPTYTLSSIYGIEINNLDRGCTAYAEYNIVSGTYRTIGWSSTNYGACGQLTGFLYVNEKTNNVTITFYLPYINPNPVVQKVFTGKQLWRQYY